MLARMLLRLERCGFFATPPPQKPPNTSPRKEFPSEERLQPMPSVPVQTFIGSKKKPKGKPKPTKK